ncbi:MAG: sulfurtransferase [Betaproteobacteria bacterium]|jgi:rhodanese-related sulfurtransferase|nr:sulfurtransferase [Betaproteobacteria bacterium]MBK7657171.1 sulfurtransferase [Betaproteobacteria bacterium]MBP6645943.1 sulfurtransferase [Burkholderiaceae bacterium]
MIEQIRPSQLAAWLRNASANGTTPVVLDVREAWELQTASVKPHGFTLLHIPMNAIPARASELNRDTPIACLCHHGGRSQQVANFLAQSGFTSLANVAGGINAWSGELDTSVPRY